MIIATLSGAMELGARSFVPKAAIARGSVGDAKRAAGPCPETEESHGSDIDLLRDFYASSIQKELTILECPSKNWTARRASL